MAEPKQTWALRNQVTGKVHHVTAEALPHYLRLQIPRAGGAMFKPLRRLPGFYRDQDQSLKATFVAPEDAHEVARRMFDPEYNYSLALGKKDPRWDIARRDEQRRLRRQVAQQESGTQFLSRAVSVATQPMTMMTGGAVSFTRFQDILAGEGSKEARADLQEQNALETLGGTMAGIALLGAMPIPGAGRIGGFLGRAGRAGPPARNVHNLFEISTAGAQGARKLVENAPTFVRSLAGTLGGAAVAEVPISMAIASADIVDHHQDWSAQAVAANGAGLAALGLGTALIGGTALAGFRQGLAGIKGGSNIARNTLIRLGVSRVVAQTQKVGPLKPTTTDLLRQNAIELGRFATRGGKAAPMSRAYRFIMGEHLDDYIKAAKTNAQLLNEIMPDNPNLVKWLEELDMNVRSPELSKTLGGILRVARAGEIPEIAKHIQSVAGILRGAEDMWRGNIRLRAPQGALYDSQFHPTLLRAMEEIEGALQGAQKSEWTKRMLKMSTARLYPELMEQMFEARMWLRKQDMGTGLTVRGKHSYTPAPTQGAALAQKMDDVVSAHVHGVEMKRVFKVLDEIQTDTLNSGRWAEDFKLPGAIQNEAHVASMFETAFRLDRNMKVLERLGINETPWRSAPRWGPRTTTGHAARKAAKESARMVERDDAIRALTAMNRMRHKLQGDASPMVPRPGARTSGELLAMQLDSIVGYKHRVKRTLKAMAQGGATQGVITYTGVLAMRELMSAEDKQQAFETYRNIVVEVASSPEKAIAIIGEAGKEISRIDTSLGTHYAQTLVATAQYLHQHMPRSDYLEPHEYSPAEIESWLERVGALEDPVSVLASAADGSVSMEAIDAVRTVYPSIYMDMMLDIIELIHKNPEKLSYPTWIGLDRFTGGSLGIVDGYIPLQPLMAQTHQQSEALGAIGQQRFQQAAAKATAAQKVGGL